MNIRTWSGAAWRDLRALGVRFFTEPSRLAIAGLILLPWGIAWLYHKELGALQPLTWILGLIAFYWLVSRGCRGAPLEVRRPGPELAVALSLIAAWMLYRIGEYWHWYPVPQFGLTSHCGPISETPLPKMLEMFLVPVIFLALRRYSIRQMGFTEDPFSWLAALIPLALLIGFGLTSHSPGELLISSGCFFFGAGLPEEFLFRAFLQSRLEALLGRPLWALWLASFVFGISHIPIDLGGHLDRWPEALLTAFTYQMSVGFALGYAYLRARNVLPLSLLHALIDAAI